MIWILLLLNVVQFVAYQVQRRETKFFERQAEFWYRNSRFWSRTSDRLIETFLYKRTEGDEWKDG